MNTVPFSLILTAAVLLAGCSQKCDCPRCPDVVTPPSHTTIVNPPQ